MLELLLPVCLYTWFRVFRAAARNSKQVLEAYELITTQSVLVTTRRYAATISVASFVIRIMSFGESTFFQSEGSEGNYCCLYLYILYPYFGPKTEVAS